MADRRRRIERLEATLAREANRYERPTLPPIPIEEPWQMYRLFLDVQAGKVDPASLEPSLAAELAEYPQQLLEASRDRVAEKIEEMFRQRVQEEGLRCRQVEVPAPEASPDEQAPPPEKA
jgi:hypothetical protein